MSTRIVTLVFLAILGTITCHAQTGQVKGCRLTSQTIPLRKSDQLTPLTGTVPANGKIEFRLKPTSVVTLEAKLSNTASMRLDVYSFKPAKREATRAETWTGKLDPNNEYALVLSNCYGTKPDTYKLEIRAQ